MDLSHFPRRTGKSYMQKQYAKYWNARKAYLVRCVRFALSGGKPEEVRLQYHAQLLKNRLESA